MNHVEKRLVNIERRLDRIEKFLTADNDMWSDPMDIIKQDNLIATIRETVERDFYISTTSEIRPQFGWGARHGAPMHRSKGD